MAEKPQTISPWPSNQVTDPRVRAVLEASSKTEVSLSGLLKAVQHVNREITGARVANQELYAELHRLRALLFESDAERSQLKAKVTALSAQLEETLEQTQEEKRYITDQQDAFLCALLEEHEQALEKAHADRDATLKALEQSVQSQRQGALHAPQALVRESDVAAESREDLLPVPQPPPQGLASRARSSSEKRRPSGREPVSGHEPVSQGSSTPARSSELSTAARSGTRPSTPARSSTGPSGPARSDHAPSNQSSRPSSAVLSAEAMAKLAAERERARSMLELLQSQRDKAHRILERVTRERDAAREEVAQLRHSQLPMAASDPSSFRTTSSLPPGVVTAAEVPPAVPSSGGPSHPSMHPTVRPPPSSAPNHDAQPSDTAGLHSETRQRVAKKVADTAGLHSETRQRVAKKVAEERLPPGSSSRPRGPLPTGFGASPRPGLPTKTPFGSPAFNASTPLKAKPSPSQRPLVGYSHQGDEVHSDRLGSMPVPSERRR